MPNTLAHLGVQGWLTRTCYPPADLKFLYIGCIIPDIGWIVQRAVRAVFPGVDKYDLLLYATVQGSLFFCLLFALAIALLTRRKLATFLLLGVSCLVHLLLDATQIKWANGVLLLAPFNWQFTSFNLFWPEALPSNILTLFGLCYVIFMWPKACTPARWHSPLLSRATLTALVLALFYFLGPPLFAGGPVSQNHFYIATLQNEEERAGKEIAFDRAYLKVEDGQAKVRNFNYEWFTLADFDHNGEESALISLKGRFLTAKRIEVTDYHLHPLKTRAAASIIGLALVLFLWLCVVTRRPLPSGRV